MEQPNFESSTIFNPDRYREKNSRPHVIRSYDFFKQACKAEEIAVKLFVQQGMMCQRCHSWVADLDVYDGELVSLLVDSPPNKLTTCEKCKREEVLDGQN